MTVTPTPNKALSQISAGTESGTWGPYVNNTTGILDNCFGGVATIPLTNASVILSSGQYQCNVLVFTGNLTANITITLPAVGSFYTVQNLTVNSSIYQITMRTAGFGEVIGAPWGEMCGIMTDGSNVRFRNMGRVGSYIDITSSSVPGWIGACTVPPYLNCNGSAFSSATYPVLRDFLGTSVLPNMSGRTRASIDDGAGVGSLGNTLFAVGGDSVQFLTTQQIPWRLGGIVSAGAITGGSGYYSINPGGGGTTGISYMPPYQVHGITMIRSG